MSEILDIACDESGHTGPDLLHKDQRYFAYASVAINDSDAYEIIQGARAAFPVQMPELKARNLINSSSGRSLVLSLLKGIEGHFIVTINDKLLALCAWFFEYIYEPVYQKDPSLLYSKNFHRFVAMYTWMWMNEDESQARKAIEQFQKYMRSRDPRDAPFLFDNPRPPLTSMGTEHPFETILRFAYGYRSIIIADNASLDKVLPDSARWTLDLSASALWSHLNHWGGKGKLLSVRCDTSKPLEAIVKDFRGDEDDPGIRRARANHPPERLGWQLLEPIAFADSRDHPAIQLADVIAGTMAAIFSNPPTQHVSEIREIMMRHVHPHSTMPDMEIIDPSTRGAAVNSLIAYDLAKRAERFGDPYENLPEMYRAAEVAWVKGDFRPGQKK